MKLNGGSTVLPTCKMATAHLIRLIPVNPSKYTFKKHNYLNKNMKNHLGKSVTKKLKILHPDLSILSVEDQIKRFLSQMDLHLRYNVFVIYNAQEERIIWSVWWRQSGGGDKRQNLKTHRRRKIKKNYIKKEKNSKKWRKHQEKFGQGENIQNQNNQLRAVTRKLTKGPNVFFENMKCATNFTECNTE